MGSSHTTPPPPANLQEYHAILFDLDGVLTPTAKIHAACWKEMFDEYLHRRSKKTGVPVTEFDIKDDYKEYVDGKPRYDGVRSFLKSRGIQLPEGSPDGPSDWETVCGLGNRKKELVDVVIQRDGVEAYPGSMRLVRHLKERGVKMAVVSSSKSCVAVLEAAGIKELFDTIMDENVARHLNLSGKPAPDTYLKAAEILGASPDQAVVVEDAISGVQAGRNGNFGLVVGVNRSGDRDALLQNGADITVDDLEELLSAENK